MRNMPFYVAIAVDRLLLFCTVSCSRSFPSKQCNLKYAVHELLPLSDRFVNAYTAYL